MDGLASYQITKLSRYELVYGSVTEPNLGLPTHRPAKPISWHTAVKESTVYLQGAKQG